MSLDQFSGDYLTCYLREAGGATCLICIDCIHPRPLPIDNWIPQDLILPKYCCFWRKHWNRRLHFGLHDIALNDELQCCLNFSIQRLNSLKPFFVISWNDYWKFYRFKNLITKLNGIFPGRWEARVVWVHCYQPGRQLIQEEKVNKSGRC